MACSVCKREFDSADGQFYEWGLTCRLCHIAVQSTPPFTGMDSPGGTDTGTLVMANAVGLGLMAVTGVGFTYGGGGEERRPIPDTVRLEMAMPVIRARLAEEEAAKRRMEIRLRQNGEITGPFTMEQLAKLWDEGKVGANDEYHCEGMADFLPVSQFVPPE